MGFDKVKAAGLRRSWVASACAAASIWARFQR
jgi:hypothetical protein